MVRVETYSLEHAFACERPEELLQRRLDRRHHRYKAYDLYVTVDASEPFDEI
jgi:hypothetical protein